MIELHRLKGDAFSDEIEQRMRGMVLAFRKKYHEKSGNADHPLPYLRESPDRIVSGKGEILEYLDQLEAELDLQRSITGDACYLDPDTGEPC